MAEDEDVKRVRETYWNVENELSFELPCVLYFLPNSPTRCHTFSLALWHLNRMDEQQKKSASVDIVWNFHHWTINFCVATARWKFFRCFIAEIWFDFAMLLTLLLIRFQLLMALNWYKKPSAQIHWQMKLNCFSQSRHTFISGDEMRALSEKYRA